MPCLLASLALPADTVCRPAVRCQCCASADSQMSDSRPIFTGERDHEKQTQCSTLRHVAGVILAIVASGAGVGLPEPAKAGSIALQLADRVGAEMPNAADAENKAHPQYRQNHVGKGKVGAGHMWRRWLAARRRPDSRPAHEMMMGGLFMLLCMAGIAVLLQL